MQKESDYLVSNPKLIAEHLTDLFKKKCIISAQFGENNASFLTAIIGLDTKNGILKLDCGPTEILTNQLLNSGKVLFRSEVDGIKVAFKGKHIKKSINDVPPTLQMPIPSTIFWMQRRQFYRVKIPLSHTGSFCEIALKNEQKEGSVETQSAKFQLSDISICGFSFLNPDSSLNSIFESAQWDTQCILHLHDGAHANIGITVKNATNIKASATTTQQRIGCLFTGLTHTFESSILRYMQEIERQTRNIGG
ncbi:MAG: flagellar brake protein [Methylomonas sp.]